MEQFRERLNLAFKTITKSDGTEYTPEDIQVATNKAVTASYIWRLRSGKAPNPTIKVVRIVSDFFGVQPGFFLDNPEEDMATKQMMNQIALRSTTLGNTDQQFVLNMIDHIQQIRTEYEEKEDEKSKRDSDEKTE